MSLFGQQQPPRRPADPRFTRDELRRMMTWLSDRALGERDREGDDSDYDFQPEQPRILARITNIQSPGSNTPLYAWEFAVAIDNGDAQRDHAGFASATDFSDLPAWEQSGNVRVPIDGSAVVELTPSSGGLYYSFTWPERYTPARVTASAGRPHAWEELAPGAGGTWAALSGGRVGSVTVNPAYERNGALDIPVGTVVWLERGYGACPDVVTSITTHGDGAAVHQVQHVYLANATGGTWTLTTVNAAGVYQVTAALAWNISAASLQTALRLLSGFGACTVTGAGTVGSPFVVTMLDTFVDLLPMVGDPFQFAGVQEWFFADKSTSPGDNDPTCTGIVGTDDFVMDEFKLGTTLYKVKQVHTLAYNADGCLEWLKGPRRVVATACIPDCLPGTGSGSNPGSPAGSGSGCTGAPQCEFCLPNSTPTAWALTLAGFANCGTGGGPPCRSCTGNTPNAWKFTGGGFSGGLANCNGAWVLSAQPHRCRWRQDKTVAGQAVEAVIGIPDATFVQMEIGTTDGANNITYEADPGAFAGDCCMPVVLTARPGSQIGNGGYPPTITITPTCAGGGGGTNPNGNYSLVQVSSTSTCTWIDSTSKTGIEVDLYFFFDPVTGLLSVIVEIVAVPFGGIIATYAAVGLSWPINCCLPIILTRLSSICATAPNFIQITPTGCCQPGTGSGGGSGSGSGGAGGGNLASPCCAAGVPSKLCATFYGALSALGSITLTGSDGSSWTCGSHNPYCEFAGNLITFQCNNDGTFSLGGGGIGVATNNPQCGPPFLWSFSGPVAGTTFCTGDFQVIITGGAC